VSRYIYISEEYYGSEGVVEYLYYNLQQNRGRVMVSENLILESWFVFTVVTACRGLDVLGAALTWCWWRYAGPWGIARWL
jgi:hypothetical protein